MSESIEKAAWDLADVDELNDPVQLVKAHIIGGDIQQTNATPVGDRGITSSPLFEEAGALQPPYPPDILIKLWEHSNSLRQNVDAYAVNIDGNGHRFEPIIDLEADDVEEKVADAIFLEKVAEAELKRLETTKAEDEGEPNEEDPYDIGDIEPPTAAEVKKRIKLLETAMRLERARLDSFFEFACLDLSFVALRKQTREDKEIVGNGFWEVLRNGAGIVAQFNPIAASTMRLLPLDKNATEIEVRVKRTPLTYDTIKVQRRFRRFIQVYEGRKIWFKEFGDPRTLSATTGKFYADDAALKAEEKESRIATEVIHFAIRSPRSPYGVPRWIGNMLAVLGSRQAEEVNFLYFENKSVPPMAILVSGGHLAGDAVKKIESFVENRIKGRQNFHKILIVQATPADAPALDASGANRTQIEIVPLTGSQQGDALFQNYDERNIDKVGMSFRLPRMIRGDIRDFNRSTAEAALEFTETQVFNPEREDFDWMINRKLFPVLGIRYWKFKSNAPTTRNPMDLASILDKLVKASILTPGEARELAEGIFNKDFKKLDDLWTQIPPDLLKAGIVPDDAVPQTDPNAPDPNADPNDPNGNERNEDDPEEERDPNADPNEPKKPKDETPEKAKARRRTEADKRVSLGTRYAEAVKARHLKSIAADLVQLRAAMLEEERRENARLAKAQRHDAQTEVVKLPPEEFAQLMAPKP